MILACTACDSRYDVTGHPVGQQFRCRCGTVVTLEAPRTQVSMLTCPHCGGGVAEHDKTCAHCSSALLLKACPRCLSRVFHGHKHCPACGTELGVAAMEPAADRLCPRCTTPMHARRVEDTVIDECERCHGIFLDQLAVKRLVEDRKQTRAEAILGALPPADPTKTSPLPAPGERMYVKCPACKQLMNRKLFSGGSGVIIDVCRAHGVYFDQGELPRVIEFVMKGGLETAHKKEIARLKDEARGAQANAQFAAMMAGRSSSHTLKASSAAAGSYGVSNAFVDLLSGLFGP